jgi:nitric oxide reductase NorD protein
MEVEKNFVEIAALLLSSHGAVQKKLDNESLLSESEQDKGDACGKDQAAAGVPPVDDQCEATDSHIRELLFLASDQDTAQQFSDLVREIVADMGAVPSSYVSSALDAATGVYDSGVEAGSAPDAAPLFTFYSYDEWDFRRGAYRKKWCTVREMTPPPVRGTLVEQVLARYRGQVASLRRQFELMRQECRRVRRQKDGDEIDIDAVVEAWADFHAGSMPSENLFTRLFRDNRDIAVLFLVDMSASTEGWINTAIKESLVLLTQAMELLNDRYAIYGFSGMQRTGCQYYVIKEFSEEYGEQVEGRITGINARDYTRMGPAIRHSIEKLMDVDARLRILLTLSDGKPEDYDEYKGPYAIEDTRRALFEAREYGIRPFCITIDSEAREYLPRLYGAANYILVPDVRLLHRRVPEIYRLLTT